jgi:ribosomal protein S27AE
MATRLLGASSSWLLWVMAFYVNKLFQASSLLLRNYPDCNGNTTIESVFMVVLVGHGGPFMATSFFKQSSLLLRNYPRCNVNVIIGSTDYWERLFCGSCGSSPFMATSFFKYPLYSWETTLVVMSTRLLGVSFLWFSCESSRFTTQQAFPSILPTLEKLHYCRWNVNTIIGSVFFVALNLFQASSLLLRNNPR